MLKKVLFSSLIGLALVAFTGCGTESPATGAAKCGEGKCDSAKKVETKCDTGKNTAPKPDAKCGAS